MIKFSRFIQVSTCIDTPLILLQSNIPLYEYMAFCFSVHEMMDTFGFFTFWQLWKMLPKIFELKFLCRHVFTILGIYLVVEFWDHIGSYLCLTFWESSRLFQSSCTIVHSQWYMKFPISSHPCQNLLLFFFSIIAILVGVVSNAFYFYFPSDS